MRLIDADQLHYHRIQIVTNNDGYSDVTSDVVVFAKEIDKLARKSAAETICFTGKRPKDLCGYNREAYKDFMKYLIENLEPLIESGYTRFITGGAQGFDQLAFWAVAHLKKKHPEIKNYVILPFEGQELQWSETGAFSQKEFWKMRAFADEVIIVEKQITQNSDQKSRNEAYHARNKAMVDNSSLVIALSNETASGGTESTIKYAQSKRIPVHCLHYDTSKGKLHVTEVIVNHPA